MSRLGEFFREGAADLFGFRHEIERAQGLEELLEGIGQDARLMARKAEDSEYTILNGPEGGDYVKEQSAKSRRRTIERAYLYYHEDPIIGQAVNLVTWYTFGRGVPKPKYRLEENQQQGQAIIDRFWADEDNQQTLTTHQAQEQKSTELQCQGDIFLVLYPEGGKIVPQRGLARDGAPILDLSIDGDAPGPYGNAERLSSAPMAIPQSVEPQGKSPLKLTDFPASEIVDIITHPDNRKIPVYYKRVYTPQVYNPKSGSRESGKPVTIYYRDWKHEAPEEMEAQFETAGCVFGEGLIYHVAVNHVSDEKFGRSELNRVLDWAKGLNSYMTSRMQVVQAIAQIAMKVKTRGGARNVDQVAQSLRDIGGLANAVEGAAVRRERAPDGATKIAVENQGAELQPMVQDTGSSGAATDLQTLLQMVAAGTGVPPHYFGSTGGASLATATAMELPVLKQMEARQELWEGVFRDILGYVLQHEGLNPEGVEVQLPSILARDAGQVANTLIAVLSSAPMIGDANLVRYLLTETLDAMGKVNAEEIVSRLIPEGWQPPMPPMPGDPASGGTPTAPTPGVTPSTPNSNGALAKSNAKADASARNGADRAPSSRGGTAASKQAAQARQDRASGRKGGRQTYTEAEVLVEAAASKDQQYLAKMPLEVRAPAQEALSVLDDLERELMADFLNDD